MEGATLTIHSVTQKDSGEYRCEVTASQDHVSLAEASITLNVLGRTGNLSFFCSSFSHCWPHLDLSLLSTASVPPHVPSCDVPNSVFVGSGLELLCKDKLSIPPATYRWYKDNRALVATADTAYSIDTNKGTLVSEHVCMCVCVGVCGGGWVTNAATAACQLTS